MHVLALNGSERPVGSTDFVVDEYLSVMRSRGWEIQKIALANFRISKCECGRCNSRESPCVVDDDVQNIVHEITQADAVVYAAPVHGFGLASTMQLFIERIGVGHLRFGRPLTNKLGAAIVTGRRYSLGSVHSQLVDNLLLNRMIVVGSGFPAVVHTAGVDGAASDNEGLDAVRRTAHRMADVGESILVSGLNLPWPSSTELRLGTTG